MALKTSTGFVIGVIDDATVKVQIEKVYVHPIYKKIIRSKINVLSHNEGLKLSKGLKVLIQETRPYSKRKTFKVIKICDN